MLLHALDQSAREAAIVKLRGEIGKNLLNDAIQGGVLLGYSYIVSDTLWLYAIGVVLTGWIWFTRDG